MSNEIAVGVSAENRFASRCALASRFLGIVSIGTAILVLVGWLLDQELLKRILPELVAMNPMAAFSFMLCGTSLVLQLRPAEESGAVRNAGRMLGVLAAVIGLLVFLSHVGGWSLRVDQWLLAGKLHLNGNYPPSRMAPHAAASFVLLGAGLFFLDWTTKRGLRISEILAAIIASVSLATLLGFAYAVDWLSGITAHVPMALHTAVLFYLLSLGVVLARPGHGWMAIITGDTAGGLLARRLLPATVGIFFAVGLLRIAGERRGFYGAELGVTLYTMLTIVIFSGLVMACAKSLHYADIHRKVVETEREQFFNLSLDILGIAGPDGYFKKVNRAFAKTLGRSEDDILTRPFLELVHPDDVEATIAEVVKLEAGLPTLHFENRYLCSDGSWKWLAWTALPVDGNIYVVGRDVTGKKTSEFSVLKLNADLISQADRLEQVNQELESFSYSVSHDLRAPLRGISGFSQALEEHAADSLDETSRGFLLRIRRAADRMSDLIDDLLKLSRLTRTELKVQRVDLSDIAESVLVDLRQADPERNVEVHIEPDIYLWGDENLLLVLMENLIGNAWKFSSRNAAACIQICKFTHEDGRAGCQVKDNGVGFDSRYVHKLFGAFQRLHSQNDFPGTGIGLATVLRIVRRHGGDVRAESDINHGAVFSFVLGPTYEK